MDISSCGPETITAMSNMLTSLYNSFSQNNAKINVGVITFRGNASTIYPLTEYTGNNTPIQTAIQNKVVDNLTNPDVLKGSNVPSGLDAAKIMLDNSTTANARKYMILVSDGATYVYTHDGDPSTHYGRTAGIQSMDGTLYEWQAKYGSESAFPLSFTGGGNAADWTAFLSNIKANRADYLKYDQEYVRTTNHPTAGLTVPNPPIADISSFITNVEEAFYQTADVFSSLANSGVNCYTINTNTNFGVFTSFMNYLGGTLGKGVNTNFSGITKSIMYLLNSGSVTDTIDSHFDLDQDGTTCPFILTRANTAIAAVNTGSNQWSFGTPDSTGKYPYVVDYTPGESEQLVLHINVPVENAFPLQLSYSLKINTTEAGKYATNTSAILKYLDTAGQSHPDETFEVPEVTFTSDGCGVPTLWCVTFLDCKGNTVSVQWVKTGEDAVPPTGFGTYSNYNNVTSHRDLRPTSCSTSSKHVVPNTANKD